MTGAKAAESDWQRWVGSRESVSDVVTLASLTRMSATFDHEDPAWRDGDPVPPLWHFMYFPPVARRGALGPDGHPARGGFLPPIPLPRRMFAGARTTYHRPLKAGEAIRREGAIARIDEKSGKSGTLVFVLIRYQMFGGDTLAVEEEHDIVYRDVAAPAKTAQVAQSSVPEPTWRQTVTPDPVTLFRFSALTFNGHRIHYDRSYATGDEGYPGLVLHGPLIACYLMELCRDNSAGRPIRRHAFRARRPLFDIDPFEVVGAPSEGGAGALLEARDPEGAPAMTLEVEFA
jgi:3-methylfumaryl-CoA hydratase